MRESVQEAAWEGVEESGQDLWPWRTYLQVGRRQLATLILYLSPGELSALTTQNKSRQRHQDSAKYIFLWVMPRASQTNTKLYGWLMTIRTKSKSIGQTPRFDIDQLEWLKQFGLSWLVIRWDKLERVFDYQTWLAPTHATMAPTPTPQPEWINWNILILKSTHQPEWINWNILILRSTPQPPNWKSVPFKFYFAHFLGGNTFANFGGTPPPLRKKLLQG